MHNNRDRGPKPNWSVVKEIEEDGIVVEISSNDAQRPRYNVRIYRPGERGPIPFLQLRTEGQGQIQIVSLVPTVTKLLAQAEEFAREQAQIREDEYIEKRTAREAREVAREGKKRRSSGYKQHGAR